MVARPRWVQDDGPAGRQRLAFEAEPDINGDTPEFDAVLPLTPPYYIAADAGIAGPLDFGLTGILAGIASTLAGAGVPIFAVSTFDTDYVLVKTERLDAATGALRIAGYSIS